MAGLGASLSLLASPDDAGAPPLSETVSEGVRFLYSEPVANKRYSQSDAFGVGVHDDAPTYTWRPGPTISEMVRAVDAALPNLKYGLVLSERGRVADVLRRALGAALGDALHVHQAETVVRALVVLEQLGVHDSAAPAARYSRTITQLLGVHDALSQFLGASLADGIGAHGAETSSYRLVRSVDEHVGLADALSRKFIVRATMAETLDIDETQVLQALYSGTIAEDVQITAGYVAPNGTFTTWAMNTRTAAVTEYQNYEFNSFAQLGGRYFGAAADGLYELIGDTDDGEDIVATIRSGFAQWAGSHLGTFKAAYLAVRGDGDFILRLITAEGQTTDYQVSARNMRSTKVHMGRGLRSRFWAFELVSAGQDFDLESLEFVPLPVQRRV